MGWLDSQGGWRHEIRTVDGKLRFWIGPCKLCRTMRCCVSREDHQLHCADRRLYGYPGPGGNPELERR